jgi:hypothetical protein
MGMERLVLQRSEVKAIQQRSSMQPRDDSLSIYQMASAIQRKADRCQLQPVTSMAAVEEAAAQPFPTACLVKPGGCEGRVLGAPTWDSPVGASLFNLRPPTGLMLTGLARSNRQT